MIPLQLKVIIIGSRQIYYTLQDLDPDFQEMFRVLVDFDEDIPLGEDSLEQFAQLLKTRTSEEGMAPSAARRWRDWRPTARAWPSTRGGFRHGSAICSSWSAKPISSVSWRTRR